MIRKVLVLCCVLAVVVNIAGCGKKPPVRAVFLRDFVTNNHLGIEFYRGAEKIAVYRTPYPCSINFMQLLDDSHEGYNRYSGGKHGNKEIADITPYLADIKGDGDKRYLLLSFYQGGNDPRIEGVLLDTKDAYSVWGPFLVGETPYLDKQNPKLLFEHTEVLCYTDGKRTADIVLLKKLRRNQEAEYLPRPSGDGLVLLKYRNILKAEYSNGREFAFASLFGDLASKGRLREMIGYARKLGFTNKEIIQYGNECYQTVRKMSCGKFIENLNGY